MITPTLQSIETYRHPERRAYPFCPGCGHTMILDKFNAALVKLQLDPRRVVIVTDIGCSGLADQYFETHAFHGLHGRSVTYATGIKLADPELKVIVMMGDGGCGIGGHHLINAARRNIGVTVLVFNNFNFGMTGGQHSVTTPHGSNTSTTRLGNLERPLDICATVMVNGASFVARKTSFDKDLPDVIAEAISHEGFALIDIWEMCTAYYVPNNNFSKKALEATLAELNFPTGVLQRTEYREYSRAYREANWVNPPAAAKPGQAGLKPSWLDPTAFRSQMQARRHIVVAGAAGQKIRSTMHNFGRGAVLSGLWVTQKDDYPVTVMTGHSVAEVILSPEKTSFTGIDRPDILVVLSPEGLSKARKYLAVMTPEDVVYFDAALGPIETRARTVAIDYSDYRKIGTVHISKDNVAVLAVSIMLRDTELYPLEAFREAIRTGQRAPIMAENLKVVDVAEAWNSG